MLERHNRHLPLGARLTGEDERAVSSKFLTQRVLLSGDPGRLATATGQMMLLVAANLIARFCPRIDVAVAGAPGQDALGLLRRIDRSAYAEFRPVDHDDPNGYAAVLSIGSARTGGPNVIAIDGVGWLALLSEVGDVSRPSHREDGNPFGALMAVPLGVAEVFKRLLQPREDKAAYFGDVTFSAFDYSVGAMAVGPRLPEAVQLPSALLAGVGAVGNAFLLALSHVPGLRGELTTVDRQHLDDPTNLNRYALAFEEHIIPQRPLPKVALASRLFDGSDVCVRPLAEDLDQALARIYGGELRRPEVVLSAVDNNSARETLQKLWPDLLLEGATDETTSQVSRHDHAQGLACLMCIHSGPGADTQPFSYGKTIAEASGFPEARISAALRDASATVTDEDVRAAGPEKRDFLAQRVGRPICSVLTEIEQLSVKPRGELPVRPAVSFVSMTSGTLLAAEYVKHAAGVGSPLETFFQMDLMFPLTSAFLQPVEKAKGCYCVQRSEEVARYRAAVEESND